MKADTNDRRAGTNGHGFGGTRDGIWISKTERGTGVSWWVGVPRGPAWDEKVKWADETMNPPMLSPSLPKGGVFR